MTEPITLAVNPSGTELFVSNVGTYGSGTSLKTTPYVAAVNTSTGREDITQPTWPDGVTVSPDGTKVYLAEATGDIAILNAATNVSLGSIGGYEGPDTVRVMGATAPTPPVVPPPSSGGPDRASRRQRRPPTTAPRWRRRAAWRRTRRCLASGSLPSGLTYRRVAPSRAPRRPRRRPAPSRSR